MFRRASIIFCIIGALPVFAHEGEDHGEKPAAETARSDNLVFMSKESQFLLKLETRIAKKEKARDPLQVLGKITHRSNGQQDLFASGSGRFVPASKSNLPIVGQLVKKGERLGYLEMIGHVELVAPFSGLITFVGFHPGEWVTAGTKMFTIVDPSVVWVEAQLFEKDLARISRKSDVRISIDNLPTETFSAKILAIGRTLDEQTRAAPVTLEVVNKGGALQIGQWAKVSIETPKEIEVIAIPKSALLKKEGVPLVFSKKSAEWFEGHIVTVVGQNDGTAYISRGLEDKQKIVTQANYQLLPFIKLQGQ